MRTFHDGAREFLSKCAADREVFCLTWATLMGYMRMATHPAIFGRPLAHEEAARNVESLMSLRHCRVIREDDSFRDTYREITDDVPTRGNLVPDAQLASIFLGHGVRTIFTHDRDFRKFSFLDVRDPLV